MTYSITPRNEVLSLFAPPIDPGLMVKARAMGLSIDSILNSTNEKRSIYRFRVIIKLAIDMAKDACQMGRDLLSILEKRDAEQLQEFKSKCDKAVIAESRSVHEMEIKSLEEEKTRLEERKTAKKNVANKTRKSHVISSAEKKYQKLMDKAAKIQEIVERVRSIASATFKIPDFKYGSVMNAFGGPRFDIESLGGTKLAENLVSAAEGYAARFAQKQLDASKTKLQGELERRKQEWLLEDELADAEIVEIEKQQVINEIKTQQAEKKYKSFENEILRSEQVFEKLSEKFTNKDLYIWLEKELGKVFKQYINLLVDVAKMAEKAYHFEIEGLTTFNPEFIGNDYWSSLYKGLLAPEKILLDIRRMEKAYLENDTHEMEITKPISLKDLFSVEDETIPPNKAINALKSDGECSFKFDINLFNADFEDFYFHRIKKVRLQVKLNAESSHYLNVRLSLTQSLVDLYKNSHDTEDFRQLGVNETYATSVTNNEFGIFNFESSSDKQNYFEGSGAISNWNLKITGLKKIDGQLPIEDVIIFLSYTAKN